MSAPPLSRLREGTSPLVISVPHAGTYLPPHIATHLTPLGQAVVDTDWHVDRLVEFAADLGATILVATHSRTVVDLNRGPDGAKLYPGQAETGICPTETFAGEPLYKRAAPDAAGQSARVRQFWQPYHAALHAALHRTKALHGYVRLLDAHSIRAHVPRLFEGRLPDLNLGTNSGAACAPALANRVFQATADQGFSRVLDGRFRGGYITRHYGRPAENIDAIQIEIAQAAYMNEADPADYDPGKAVNLVAALRRVAAELLSK